MLRRFITAVLVTLLSLPRAVAWLAGLAIGVLVAGVVLYVVGAVLGAPVPSVVTCLWAVSMWVIAVALVVEVLAEAIGAGHD